MTIKRHGINEAKAAGQQALPFAKATEADGWLYVSGQTPMVDGEIIDGGIVAQAPRVRAVSRYSDHNGMDLPP